MTSELRTDLVLSWGKEIFFVGIALIYILIRVGDSLVVVSVHSF